MGKIKIASIGSESEEELKEKQKIKREEKKKRIEAMLTKKKETAGDSTKTEKEDKKDKEEKKTLPDKEEEETQTKVKKGKKKAKFEGESGKHKGKRYQEARMKVDPTKQFIVSEAVTLLKQVSFSNFDATVELHINTVEKGLRGHLTFPHGTGKEMRVVIADEKTIDGIIDKVTQGKIEFDALVAHPSVMPKLARVAKTLGPKGLMPNPKNNTISTEPEKIAAKLKAGEISWKTESDFPIIHQRVGKMSFTDKQLEDNIQVFIKSIGLNKIVNITLKSTHSPGIKVKV